jgi:uncharacterized membrane protein
METPIADIWSLPNAREALTIFAMFCATYSTRLIGWLLLRNRTISPAFRRALEAAPGCVMAAIVAPQFMTTNPITITGLCTAVAVAVWSRNMAATVIVPMLVYAGVTSPLIEMRGFLLHSGFGIRVSPDTSPAPQA